MSESVSGSKRTIVITGASAGIGAALAREVSRRGARVVVAARREAVLREVASQCGDALVVVGDVTRREACAEILRAALERFGQVDVWINNAGRGITRQPSEITDEDFDEMMAVNVKSAIYGVQAVLPHFKERGTGHIINVSSMLGRVPLAVFRSAYNAAKYALNGYTASLRLELQAEHPGIHVTTVMPGVVATEFGVNALHGGVDSRLLPMAQPVDEVAACIADVIDHPRAEVYTRPQYAELVRAYYSAADVADVEARPPFAAPPR